MRIGYRRLSLGILGVTVTLALGGCASVHNLPLNVPSANPFSATPADAAEAVPAASTSESDNAAIGLAFSGGGTRAAAFAYGVLAAIGAHPVARPAPSRPARAHRHRLGRVGRFGDRRLFRPARARRR